MKIKNYVNDIKQDIIPILLISLLSTIIVFFIWNLIPNASRYFHYKETLNNLPSGDIVYFKTEYKTNAVNSDNVFTTKILEEAFEHYGGFSYITSVGSEDGTPIFIGLGHFADVYNIQSESDGNNAYFGVKVDRDDIYIPSIRSTIIRDEIIEDKYFFLVDAMESLDDKILVNMEFETFKEEVIEKLDASSKKLALAESYANLRVIDMPTNKIQELVEESSQLDKIDIQPKKFNIILEQNLKENEKNNLYILIFTISAIVFLVGGIWLHMINFLEKRFRNFAIHEISGSSLMSVWKRILFSLISMTLLPFLFILLLNIGLPESISNILILTLYLSIVVLLSMLLLFKFSRKDLINHLRSE